MKIAVVGATGLVGSKMLQVLDEQHVEIDELIVAASERSVGKEIVFRGKTHQVISVEDAIDACPDIAIFSAGAAASRQYAPQFAEKGTYVIDNSSAWRMDDNVPLVVPEINADIITRETHIIANPNCSTIQMVMALAPLHKTFDIKRLVIATYQSVSGSGLKGINQLNKEESGEKPEKRAYPHQIYRNVLPHGGDFCDNGYTTEEEKLVNETHKILRAPQIGITATVCRVPVTGGHSEAVNVEFNKPFELDEIRKLLSNFPGIIVQDDPANNFYPMAIQSVSGSGLKGINQLNKEESGEKPEKRAYPHQIYRNVLPHGGDFCDNGYTTEEEKLVNETHKILRAPQIGITATVCRVPVTGGHSEAVNVEFNKPFELDEIRKLLSNFPGIIVQDDPANNFYPMAITAYDKDEVFIGRIRRDFSVANGLNFWVVSDNIRKGAATNAVQIAQYVIRQFFKK